MVLRARAARAQRRATPEDDGASREAASRSALARTTHAAIGSLPTTAWGTQTSVPRRRRRRPASSSFLRSASTMRRQKREGANPELSWGENPSRSSLRSLRVLLHPWGCGTLRVFPSRTLCEAVSAGCTSCHMSACHAPSPQTRSAPKSRPPRVRPQATRPQYDGVRGGRAAGGGSSGGSGRGYAAPPGWRGRWGAPA